MDFDQTGYVGEGIIMAVMKVETDIIAASPIG
jgi:hypothetical protein